MLNADWSVVIVVFVLLLFAVHIRVFAKLIYFNLFNLFNLEMEWSDATTLQLIKLYENRPYLCDEVKSQCATGRSQHMQLYRVTKLREKIAGVTSVLLAIFR